MPAAEPSPFFLRAGWAEPPKIHGSHANNLPELPDIPLLLEFVRGDDPDNQVANSIPNEVAQVCYNPAEFPVNKVNIRTLQMTSGLSSGQQLIALNHVQ